MLSNTTLNDLVKQTEKEEVKSWIKTTLTAYNKKTKNLELSEAEHIIDFLNSETAPKRLKRMSFNQAKTSSEKWVKSLKKKGKDIKETKKDTKTIKRWKNGYRLVQLVSENSFKREGNLMSHCVASYYNKDNIKVYSLRDEKNMPHCTIEVAGESSIQQIKGKGNGHIHPKYIKYIIQSLKKFDIEVRNSEMSNLGYNVVEKDLLKLVKKVYNKTSKMLFKYKNENYLYKYHNLEV